MDINKEIINSLINEFKEIKDTIHIKTENLINFDSNNKEDAMFKSFIDGQGGGYYIKFLNFLIKKLNLKTIVELGNREGLSTLSIYDTIQDNNSEFYTIDILKDQRYCPPQMFNDSKVKFLFGDVCSYDIINQLPKKIDLLFSDTIHFDFQIRDEFEIYQHLLADKALVAIDDIHLNDKGVFFDELHYSKWDLTELCHVSGWGLFLFERKQSIDSNTQKENLYLSIIKVWERKYQTVYKELSKPDSKERIKNAIKKISFIYKTKLMIMSIFRK